MSNRKPWEGPFKFENGGDGKCVKCDAKWQYRISFGGYAVAVCREHAIEGLTSKEGRRTIAEAEREIDEIDDERWRSMNTHRLTWVPVEQRLPEKGIPVIGWLPGATQSFECRFNEHDGVWCDYGTGVYLNEHEQPTHWMPFPPAPRPTEVK